MMRTIRSAFLFATAVLVLGARAPQAQEQTVVDKIIDEGKNRSEVQDILFHLTTKIGPRLTSSAQLTKAGEWAKASFEKWGLKNCQMWQWGTFPIGFTRGPFSGKMTAPEEIDFLFATNTWTPGTNGPVEGLALIGPKSEEELAALEPKLKNAWILSPGTATNKALNEKILEAYDKAGIAGLIRKSPQDNLTVMGNSNVNWDKLPTRVNVVLHAKHYNKVKELLGEGKEVKLKFDIKNEFVKGPIPLYNVIAEIPGTEKPDEYVIVGGHLDSWDGAQGTTDNGTGTSTTMEAARLLMKAGAKPKRTIRFMLWSGEEQGLLGSSAYVKKHPKENAKISAVLVHDGGTNYVSGIKATRAMVPLFEKIFEPVMKLDENMKFKIEEVGGLPRGVGSDHDSYCSVGVPGFFWNQAGKAVYGRTWHTWYDTFDAAVPEYQRHTSMVVAIGALGIANLDTLLPREGLFGGGAAQRRTLGVEMGEDGVTISGIVDGGAAEKAGLKKGDKILKIGDEDVTDQQEYRKAIRAATKKTKIKVLRDGKELEVDVEFDR